MKRRGVSPAARFAAFHVPKCSMTVCGWTLASGSAANSASSASGRADRPTRGARRGSRRPCSGGAFPRGTRRAPARRSVPAPDDGGRAVPCNRLDHLRRSAKSPERPLRTGTLGRMSARLSLETSAARLVGRLSRAAGRGGGTTLPGKLVWRLDPGALDALAGRLPLGVALVSRRTGRRRPRRWPRRSSRRTAPRVESLGREPRFRASRRRCSPHGTPISAPRGRRVRAAGDAAPHPASRRRAGQPVPRPARPLRRARAHRGALACGGDELAPGRARRERRRSPRRSARRRAGEPSSSGSTTRAARVPCSSTPRTRSTARVAAPRTTTTRPTSATSARIGVSAAATRGRASISRPATSSRTAWTACRSAS